MTRQGQCVTCVRWARQGGSILPAVEGCGWLADHDARPLSGALRMLLPVLAQIAARDGCCPGHLEAKLADMPDAYLAADLPREASAGPGLMAQQAMRS